MAKIYLINVGANAAHSGEARSPVFDDGRFEYVSFPDTERAVAYPDNVRLFIKPTLTTTHLDPDWRNLTYGDWCKTPRARALSSAEVHDILLFWGLLWHVADRRASIWESAQRGWYLFGALRVKRVLKTNESLCNLPASDRKRLESNVHVHNGKVEPRERVRVFLGARRYSAKFDQAVDLGVYQEESLLQKILRSSDGRIVRWYERPRWNSVTRTCRAIIDLDNSEHRLRAEILRDAIQAENPSFDLLAGLDVG